MDVFALSTRIEAKGGQDVIRTLEQVDRTGKRTAATLDSSSRQLSSGFNRAAGAVQSVSAEIALLGKTGTGGLKQLLTSATNIAFAFGPVGAIAAGIALTITSIVGMHSRAREEMRKTAEQHAQTIERLAERADAVATRAEQRRAAREVQQLRARQATLRAEIGSSVAPTLLGAGGTGGGGAPVDPFAAQRRELTSINVQLAEAERHHRSLTEMQALQASISGQLAITHADLEQRAQKRREHEEAIAKAIAERERILDRELGGLSPGMVEQMDFDELALEIERRGIRLEVPIRPVLPKDREVIQFELVESLKEQVDRAFERFLPNVADSFIGGFEAAFTGGFDSAGDVILQSLGRIFTQMGAALITAGLAMEGLLPALFNPFTSGPAMIGAGAILVALGGALKGALLGGGGKRVEGHAPTGRSPSTERFVVGQPSQAMTTGSGQAAANLSPMPPITVNATIIGANDPRAQREVVELVRNAAARGIKP